VVHSKYIKEFESIAKAKHGLTILNANMDSKIDCFEKMPLDEALKLIN